MAFGSVQVQKAAVSSQTATAAPQIFLVSGETRAPQSQHEVPAGGARGSCVLTAACVTVMRPVLTPFLTLLPLLPCLLRSSPTCLLDAPVVGQVRSCALVFAHAFPFTISCSFPSDLPNAPLNSRSCGFQKQHSLLPYGLL